MEPMNRPTCASYENGHQCRRRAKWLVDGYPVCDKHRAEYPFSKLPAKAIR